MIMAYKIITYTPRQREKNLINSIEIGEEMGFNSRVITLYKTQLKEVQVEIEEETQRIKGLQSRGVISLS